MLLGVDRARFDLAYRALLSPTVVVIVQEDEQWCVIGQDIYVAACGRTRDMALLAWRRTFLADLLLHAMSTAEWPMRCPEATWKELVERSGATITCAWFVVEDGGEVIP